MPRHAHFLIGAGCFWKTEAAYRFLHGVDLTEVGYIALPPDEEATPVLSSVADAHRVWRVEVLAVKIDLDVLPLARFMDVFWLTHTATEQWDLGDVDFMSCRSVLVVPDPDLRAEVMALVADRRAAHGVKTRVFAQAAYLRAADSEQDFFVRHPDDSYSTTQVLPCLKKLWDAMPEQMDLDDGVALV